MSELNDSPISRLDPVASLSAGDLFLISKLSADGRPYGSKRIEYHEVLSSVISSMGGELSTYTERELSAVLGGTVTLAVWPEEEPEG